MNEQQLEKFNPENRATPIDREMSPEERDFIKHYMATGDAAKAVEAAFPHKHYTKGSRRVIGHKLVKKFALKEGGDKLKERINIRSDRRSDEIVQYLKRQYKDGVIDEAKLLSEMTYLAYHYDEAKIRIDALKTLHSWYDKAKAEIQANKLEGVDVVKLMAEALSSLPHDKYIAVLYSCRALRQDLIKRRTQILDPDKIQNEVRQKIQRGEYTNVKDR